MKSIVGDRVQSNGRVGTVTKVWRLWKTARSGPGWDRGNRSMLRVLWDDGHEGRIQERMVTLA